MNNNKVMFLTKLQEVLLNSNNKILDPKDYIRECCVLLVEEHFSTKPEVQEKIKSMVSAWIEPSYSEIELNGMTLGELGDYIKRYPDAVINMNTKELAIKNYDLFLTPFNFEEEVEFLVQRIESYIRDK